MTERDRIYKAVRHFYDGLELRYPRHDFESIPPEIPTPLIIKRIYHF